MMGCLSMAPIESCIPMDLRDNELKHGLLSLSLFGLPIQEAVPHDQLFLGGLPMLDHLVED